MSEQTDEPLEMLVGLVAVATLPAAALAGIFFGGSAAGVVAIVGWLFLVPVLGVLSDYLDVGAAAEGSAAEASVDGRATDREDDPLQRLRERYAAGEIDDAEFERRLERLLETEDVAVPDHVTLDGDRSDSPERERELE